ncbi:MAG: hypothetical protein RIR86_978 [Acidobacteriota bacterium]
MVLHPDVTVDRPLHKDVEPAAAREDRHLDVAKPLFITDRAPVLIVVGMGKPVTIVLNNPARALEIAIHERKVIEDRLILQLDG